jgi:hypothetical protein
MGAAREDPIEEAFLNPARVIFEKITRWVYLHKEAEPRTATGYHTGFSIPLTLAELPLSLYSPFLFA